MDVVTLENIAKMALQGTFDLHNKLGEKGRKEVKTNAHGDIAVRMDVEAEEIVINIFRNCNVPIRIVSEEHGTVDLSDKPEFLGILDGLDGSSVYKKGHGRCGTMFGIFRGIDPRFDDYVFSGVMEHVTERLFYAVNSKGAFVDDSGQISRINVSRAKSVNSSNIYVDANPGYVHFEATKRNFDKVMKLGYEVSGSSAVYYVDLASGASDLVLECTRKGNLELAVAYGLVKEAGGVIVDVQGKSISSKKYFEFGQQEHVGTIAAATHELADNVVKLIN